MTTNLNYQTAALPAEDDLINCLVSDDQRDFARLYDHFSGSLSGIIQRWVKDTDAAENILQDVFIRAWRNRRCYETGKGRIFTWLYKITRNICIDYFRSRAYKGNQLFLFGDDTPGLLSLSNDRDAILPDAIGLRKIVDTLRKEEKEVVDLVYFKGLTQRQVAEVLNVPVGTIKTRMRQAIKELRYFYKSDWKQARAFISLN